MELMETQAGQGGVGGGEENEALVSQSWETEIHDIRMQIKKRAQQRCAQLEHSIISSGLLSFGE